MAKAYVIVERHEACVGDWDGSSDTNLAIASTKERAFELIHEYADRFENSYDHEYYKWNVLNDDWRIIFDDGYEKVIYYAQEFELDKFEITEILLSQEADNEHNEESDENEA